MLAFKSNVGVGSCRRSQQVSHNTHTTARCCICGCIIEGFNIVMPHLHLYCVFNAHCLPQSIGPKTCLSFSIWAHVVKLVDGGYITLIPLYGKDTGSSIRLTALRSIAAVPLNRRLGGEAETRPTPHAYRSSQLDFHRHQHRASLSRNISGQLKSTNIKQ
jgi:hypothetical protein